MTTRQPDTAQLRKSLDLAFDDSGFSAFCFDYFPKIYDRFSSGMRRDEKIQLLLAYCRRLPRGFDILLEIFRKVSASGQLDGELFKPVIGALEAYTGVSRSMRETIQGAVESQKGRQPVTTSNFLQLLSPALRKTFFDRKSSVGEGAVVLFAGGLLEVASKRVRRRFKQPAREAALERVVQISLAAGLLYLQDCGKAEGDGLQSFGKWLEAEEVLSEFSLLLAPNEEEPLDIDLLADEFEATGYSAEFLSPMPFSDLVLDMVGAFYMAAAQEEGVQEVIKIALLRQMAEKMGALARMEALAARMAAASEQAVDQLALIRRQLEQQEIGQRITNELLQEIKNPVLDIRDQLSRQKASDAAQLAEREQRYRQTVINLFETLSFKGISPSGRAIALQLADVYVELKAVADVPEAADTYSAEERRLLVEAEERGLDKDALGIQLDSLRYLRWKERGRQPSQALERRSIQEILTDPLQRGVVILGDPGSGKTTLLQSKHWRADLR